MTTGTEQTAARDACTKVEIGDIKSLTEKTYTVTFDGAEPRDWPWSSNRTYRPCRLVVVKRDGNISKVELSGPMVKKDGKDGAQWAHERFHGEKRPSWLTSIIGGLA